MRTAIIATVGLLLLSVAALSTPASAQAADPAADVVRPGAVPDAGATALAASGVGVAADRATWRGRALALPGLDAVGGPVLVALGGLLGLLAAGALLRRRSGGDSGEGRPPEGEVDPVDGEGVTPTAQSSSNREPDDEPPPIRTDEEYVVQLLIANHGRMKQARIVEETDWSKAKVSRLLSRMEERDQVVRERAGREKVVQLADANTSIPL